ncbi:AzlD domain-containing protein [Pseudomonas sp. F1_0610]|uniref:AzlD domain-containing protein n=1 Tax=Pseudomonas sp. F1_0610 TaxID=3114284 RepID=UPI0039C1737D
MTWLLLFSLAAILFLNRYLLLEPRLPIRLPVIVRQTLHYSAPCLLTAICGPIILNKGGLSDLPSNPYLYAAIFSIACALFIRNMLLSVLVSLAGFYSLLYFFF